MLELMAQTASAGKIDMNKTDLNRSIPDHSFFFYYLTFEMAVVKRS